jgi:hypothetical protein
MTKLCATFVALSAAMAATVAVHAQDGVLLPDQIKWAALPADVAPGAQWMMLLDKPVHYTLRVISKKGAW